MKRIIVLVLFGILGFMINRFIIKTPEVASAISGALFPGSNKAVRGGEIDEHGCVGSAGYSWCEPMKKCIKLGVDDCI